MLLTPKLYVAHHCLSFLEKESFSVVESLDYQASIDTLQGLGKSYLTPSMSPIFNDFTQDNCFWLILQHEGQPIGGIAARRDRLGSESLASFLRRAMRRHYGEGKRDQINVMTSTLEREIYGSVTYFGDLLLEQNYRGYGTHLRCFTMLAQMTAAIKWDSDWAYAFISARRLKDVGQYPYGFARVIPGAQTWLSAPETRSSSECFCYSSRQDVADMARFYCASPDQL